MEGETGKCMPRALALEIFTSLGLNPQLFINETFKITEELLDQCFDLFQEEASKMLQIQGTERERDLEQGLSSIKMRVQFLLNKNLMMWEEYCLQHCFSLPKGFTLPQTNEDSDDVDMVDDSQLDAELETLRKKLELVEQECADLSKELETVDRQAVPPQPSNPTFQVTLTAYYLLKQLTIPVNFARVHIKQSPMIIKLVDHEGNQWKDRLTSIGHKHYIRKGWKHFVQGKQLRVGDVCMFEKLLGDDEFRLRVTIIKASETPIEINEPPNTLNIFKVALTAKCIKLGVVHVPSAFVWLYMDGITKMIINLVDEEHKEWKVTYLHRTKNKYVFSAGWRQFVRGKNLVPGSVCTFEWIAAEDDEIRLKVSIS